MSRSRSVMNTSQNGLLSLLCRAVLHMHAHVKENWDVMMATSPPGLASQKLEEGSCSAKEPDLCLNDPSI